MPLQDVDYRELLRGLREVMRARGLGVVDEQLLQKLGGSEGPFYDLRTYLRLLIDEISLGSDIQLRAVLARVRAAAETASGRPIEGFRVDLTPQETRLFDTEFLDFAPTQAIREAMSQLREVLEDLDADRRATRERSGDQ